MMNTYLVIPAFNEEVSLTNFLPILTKYDWNIIVVNDCSSDNTAKVVMENNCILVNHTRNLGYDAALLSGIQKAVSQSAEKIVTLDADGQHDVKDVLKIVELLDNYATVSGIRPYKQRVSEYIFEFYTKLRFGVIDPLCGLKGYSSAIFQKIDLMPDFTGIGSQWLLNSRKNNFSFHQINIKINKRIAGKPRFGSGLKSNLFIFKALIRVIFKI